jgi:hypothetical protein
MGFRQLDVGILATKRVHTVGSVAGGAVVDDITVVLVYLKPA